MTSSYSLGRLLASVVFGYWSDKRRAMEPLIVSTILLIVGSILYSYAQAFGDKGLYVVLIARTMQGMSSGKLSNQPPKVFYKKGVLTNFAKFTGNHLCQNLYQGLRPATLLKNRLRQRCFFPANFAKFLRGPSLQNTSWWLLLKQPFIKVSVMWYMWMFSIVIAGFSSAATPKTDVLTDIFIV